MTNSQIMLHDERSRVDAYEFKLDSVIRHNQREYPCARLNSVNCIQGAPDRSQNRWRVQS